MRQRVTGTPERPRLCVYRSLGHIYAQIIDDRSGRTLSGQTIDAFWVSMAHARPLSVGINCALGARDMRPYVAELARVDGRTAEARGLYRRAIELAREGEYQQEEALGNELLGELWLGDHEPELARVYLGKARHLYELWGATAKVREMEGRRPDLLSGAPRYGARKAPRMTSAVARPAGKRTVTG